MDQDLFPVHMDLSATVQFLDPVCDVILACRSVGRSSSNQAIEYSLEAISSSLGNLMASTEFGREEESRLWLCESSL